MTSKEFDETVTGIWEAVMFAAVHGFGECISIKHDFRGYDNYIEGVLDFIDDMLSEENISDEEKLFKIKQYTRRLPTITAEDPVIDIKQNPVRVYSNNGGWFKLKFKPWIKELAYHFGIIKEEDDTQEEFGDEEEYKEIALADFLHLLNK